MAESNAASEATIEPPAAAASDPPAATTCSTVALPESVGSDSMVTALARLKEKISRLELDRQTAESDMRKLAEETSLFRAQMQVYDRECRRADKPFMPFAFAASDPPEPPPPAALTASQASLGPRHFDGKETEDELFFVPEAKMVAQAAMPVTNTLDIVENRCFALEQEFRLMRELLEDADRNAVASRDLLLARQPPPLPPPDLRQKRRRERLDGQLLALLGPPKVLDQADCEPKRRPKDVPGNVRPRKPKPRAIEDPRSPSRTLAGESDRRKARAIVSDLHLELEGLKEEHRVLAQRLASESNRAQKALLMRDLDRVVRSMEQKGEQMGRLKTYMRRGHAAGRLVVRSKDSLASEPVGKDRELLRRPRKVNPTLSVGDVRWTNAP